MHDLKRFSVLTGRIVIAALAILGGSFAAAQDFEHDRQKAARGLGYANGAYLSHKCKESETLAPQLQRDIMAYYHFTDDDLAGRTEIGKSVDLGRKHARQDARRPAEFCDRMEEVLSLWRSNVLPSPQ
jgi:hypothetical protein